MSKVTMNFDDKAARKFFNKIVSQTKKLNDKQSSYISFVVAKHVVEDVTDHFDNQQGGPSALWPEWSDVYLKHMKKIGKQGNNILTASARLRNSFGPTNYEVKGGAIEFFNPAKTASGFPYAAAHNKGGPKLPKRRFMWLSNKAKKAIMRDTLSYLLNGGR